MSRLTVASIRSHLLISCSLAIACSLVGCARDDGREISGLASIASPSTRPTFGAGRNRPLEHRLVTFDLDDLARRGHFDHTVRDDQAGGIVLRPAADAFPLVGTWISDTITADFPFTELLPSWNATVPERAGTRFDVRVRDAATGEWSPWLYIGYWGRVTTDGRVVTFQRGKVDDDTLLLSSPANAFEVRATLQEFNATPTASPALRRLAVVYSRAVAADVRHATDADRAGTDDEEPPATRPARVDLPVPYRGQGDNPKTISGSTCSPTSVNMVLAWAGTDRPMLECAMAIWDDDNEMFGNWNRAVQYAASLGHEAQLERFTSMDDVRARLATGQPLIASIRFRKGEFPSNVQKASAGHLIVVRGYTETGDLICNDPASRARGNGIVYNADELARAWFGGSGGVTYVIGKKQ